MLSRRRVPLYNPYVGHYEQSNIKHLPVAKLSYARWPTDDLIIAPQTENHTKRRMKHRLHHFFIVALFCNQSKGIHVVLLTTREMLIWNQPEAR
jgi:hypothetical protein